MREEGQSECWRRNLEQFKKNAGSHKIVQKPTLGCPIDPVPVREGAMLGCSPTQHEIGIVSVGNRYVCWHRVCRFRSRICVTRRVRR